MRGVQVKKIQKALRFRKKSSVEQYLTVYTEKSTSEITKKFTGPTMVRKWRDLT